MNFDKSVDHSNKQYTKERIHPSLLNTRAGQKKKKKKKKEYVE